MIAAASGVLAAGFILGAGNAGVSARPTVVLEQGAPSAPAPGDLVGPGQGSNGSVSGDGRFVAYEGSPAGGDGSADSRTSTIYLTDRESNTTTEVTTVPDGLRPGDSVHPVMSGDGCNIVVVTELALDVFRDDDTGDRWDVYRLRLQHCGGAPGSWSWCRPAPMARRWPVTTSARSIRLPCRVAAR